VPKTTVPDEILTRRFGPRSEGDRIRIAHCVQMVHSGGVERRRLLLARGLNARRFEQILICTSAEQRFRSAFEESGCHVHEVGHFRLPLDPAPLFRAFRVLRDFRPHIVHGAIFEGTSMAAIAGCAAHVPIRIGEETSKPVTRKRRADLLLRALSCKLDRMVGVSPAVCKYLAERVRIPDSKIHLITNGVAEPAAVNLRDVQSIRSRIGADEDTVVIGSVGRLQDPVKRFGDIIRAFSKVRTHNANVVMMIVGDGPDRKYLERLSCELHVQEFVHFMGYQENSSQYFHAMDILAHVPAQEAFGLVLAEAMLAGKPIVASNVGGIPDIVDDGLTGLLVEWGDIEALSSALISLLAAPEWRTELGNRGRLKAQSKFTAKRYVEEVEFLYDHLLMEHH